MAYEEIGSQGLITPSASTGDSGTTKISFTRGSIKYDTPFLDMTSTFLPKSIKGMLRFIASYVVGDGLISQCITKMSEYPITKLLYNDDEPANIKNDNFIDNWKEILERKMKIIRTLKQCGMDYYAYGNSIISINYPFKRLLKCPKCGKEASAGSLKEESFKSFKFIAKCGNCEYKGEMEPRDINTKEINKISIVHWDLQFIDIKYNSITGDHFYYYTIPPDMQTSIKRGDMDIINTTRLEVIKSVEKSKQLKLLSRNVFHLKRPAPQYLIPSERGWGIPVVMPVMKDIFHIKILKKGNEMIAFDHIVPLRILFPQGTGDVSPHMTINLSGWKTKIEEEIRKWRADPNYISVVPIPLGMQNFSGDSKILSVTPEIKATEDTVITGIGIIPEIIRGGASWSGSNVSLRVVENTFLNHRNDIHDLIDFVVDNVASYLDKPKVNVTMSDFKMADDLEKKRLVMSASSGRSDQSLISKTTVTKELGFDPDEEYRNRENELKKNLELRIKEIEGDAEAQGSASVINAMYQADAEVENRNRMEMHDREIQSKREQFSQMDQEQNAQGVADDVSYLSQVKSKDHAQISIPNLVLILTQRFARLAEVNKNEFKIRMLAMKNSTPNLYHVIYNNLKEMNLIEADLIPDLEQAQKYTPGEIPSYMQGESNAEEPPTPAEAGADTGVVDKGYDKPLPEARPPVSKNAPI